jgi:hypothetical protein
MPDNPSPTAKQRSSRFVKSIGGIWAPHTKARLTKEITEAEQAAREPLERDCETWAAHVKVLEADAVRLRSEVERLKHEMELAINRAYKQGARTRDMHQSPCPWPFHSCICEGSTAEESARREEREKTLIRAEKMRDDFCICERDVDTCKVCEYAAAIRATDKGGTDG